MEYIQNWIESEGLTVFFAEGFCTMFVAMFIPIGIGAALFFSLFFNYPRRIK